ncbi:MAG: NADH-quinone oxidoreductase subunit G, partial [Campylobacteraceae bacterium]|nr:NADH-quinone oxidoreductase subunit G [Campylobacteraceae bacterium]
MITIMIDDKPYTAQEGEYILGIARRNHLFIPALCYLSGCSPTLACRLCLVDIDGKRAYACNAKAKDGMSIITSTPEIEAERKAIMQVYDVNHPLECGVCDQSGECELQNYNLEMEVDIQEYSIADTHRPIKLWGKIQYDPSLCIVCERCITVCKDKIGETALKTVPRGGDILPKEWKEKMPKDAYAVWNKLQKSLIGPSMGDELVCTQCGECASVCPVGALVGADFQYKANAWELSKIPALNPHSSDCSPLYYEVRHHSISNPKPHLYRVSNEFHFSTLNPAARWGYDFENSVENKDEATFYKIVNAIKEKKVETILFNSFITNEEALILQTIKQKYNLNLLNPEAKRYQDFLNAYTTTSGSTLYSATAEKISKSDGIISVGTAIKTDAPNLGYALNNALTINKAAALYFHPIKDPIVEKYSRNILTIPHKIGTEEAVLWWVLGRFGKDLPEDISKKTQSYLTFEEKEVEEVIKETVKEMVTDEDSGETKEVSKIVSKSVTKKVKTVNNKLWEMLGVDDEEEAIQKLFDGKENFTLISGEDLYTHPRSHELAKLLGFISRYCGIEIMLIPPRTNSLGVALICELDKDAKGKVLGYNEKADLTLSALGDGDLDMPALNQQEGTFVNYDCRVMPTNAALEYKGYCLNDIANALGLESEYTIDYTAKLPLDKGFQEIAFDDLPNHFENDGTFKYGYLLSSKKSTPLDEVADISLLEWEGESLYFANPVHQFSSFTNRAHQLNEAGALYVSKAWLEKRGWEDGQMVRIKKEG